MATKINLLEEFEKATSEPTSLERVRIGGSQTALIMFTAEAVDATLHYCTEPEINDYVHCNGKDCVLCRIGRAPTDRWLLPVYDPLERQVRVLPVPTNTRPGSLRPQLVDALRSEKPCTVFVARGQDQRYSVDTTPLPDGVDAGESVIQQFKENLEAGRVGLASIYPSLSNEELARIRGIAETLRLKGVRA